MVDIEQYIYGMTPDGDAAIVYTMRADNGSVVELCNKGASVLSVRVPDRDGTIADVVLGYSSFENMERDTALVGRTIGRVAGRIGEGVMTINGEEHHLEINSGASHSNGGSNGFHSKVWESRVETNRVVMSLHSPDQEQGYPAALDVEALFDFDGESLEITYRAVSSALTPLDITSRIFFNLSDEQTALDHELKLRSLSELEMDEYQLPTGVVLERPLASSFTGLDQFKGAESYFVVDGWSPSILGEVATLRAPSSGRQVTMFSSAPVVTLNRAATIAFGSPISKSGSKFSPYQGVALCSTWYPNAVNRPSFPTMMLEAGALYCHKIVYKFETY